jgi:hypothetical protein
MCKQLISHPFWPTCLLIRYNVTTIGMDVSQTTSI